MKFRNYCIFVMGDTKNVLGEIMKVSETKPNVLSAGGILIATFSSVAEIRELKDYFKLNGRNVYISDLNPDYSAFHFTKEEINEGLFGFLREMTDDKLNIKSLDLIQEISSTTTNKLSSKSGSTESHVSLDKQLKDAVEAEDYTLAIKLRDEIKKQSQKAKKKN